jgi:hypothetical protein
MKTVLGLLVRVPIRDQVVLAFLSIWGVVLSGCHNGAVLHPIQGTSPKYHAVLDVHGAFDSASFSADLDNDKGWVRHEECRGQWETAGPPKPPADGNALATNDMTAVWDTVYGERYYEANFSKFKRCARGSGKSKQGTILEAEICKLPDEKKGKLTKRGVARDNKGNIYRLDIIF